MAVITAQMVDATGLEPMKKPAVGGWAGAGVDLEIVRRRARVYGHPPKSCRQWKRTVSSESVSPSLSMSPLPLSKSA